MLEHLNISLIQSSIHWNDIHANLAMFEEKIWSIEENTHLILLPETFNTGFVMDSGAKTEIQNGLTFKWMHQMAQQFDASIGGSFLVKEKGKIYNRFYLIKPNGSFGNYDKKHLFRLAEEHKLCESGQSQKRFNLGNWSISPFICYDLRFPVWMRNERLDGNLSTDLYVVVANWPAARKKAWLSLLCARAIENQAYVAGVNRTGTDNNLTYEGDSVVFSPIGEHLNNPSDKDEIITIKLSKSVLNEARKQHPFYLDADNFRLL